VVTPGEGPTSPRRRLRVLRISHSGVVTSWRERERGLRRLGVELTLVTAARWDEGGAAVPFTPEGDDFVVPVRTFGTHPNLFVFDPRPLWRLLGDDRWDLVDLHEEPFGLAVAEFLLLRWLRRRRTPFLVCSAQNLDKSYPLPFRWIERRSLAGAAGAYTCNTEAGEILRRKGLRGELELLPLGVDVARFRPAERRPPADRLRVGFVGRLYPVKGAHVLLAAAARDPRIDVEICGAGPEAGALATQVATLGISDRVTFHGHVDESALPDVYPTFDVLAVPSIPVPGSLEQFGRAVVEGQASGVPCVASASGALPDVVGDAGLLVPPGDPEALCDALVRVLEEPGLWTDLRDAGLASVDRYSWSGIAENQEDLYQRAVRRATTLR
jgi:glycosyltransferase involved in cell wall biosynthesis